MPCKRLEGNLMGCPKNSFTHLHSIYHMPRIYDQKLPENIIIDLHRLFLTKGIHTIMAEDRVQAHQIVDRLLRALNCYNQIAFLSLGAIAEYDDTYCNLHTLLHALLDNQPAECLDFELSLSDIFFDFLIVDQTNKIAEKIWFQQIMQAINDLEMHNHMPIIYITHIKEV